MYAEYDVSYDDGSYDGCSGVTIMMDIIWVMLMVFRNAMKVMI